MLLLIYVKQDQAKHKILLKTEKVTPLGGRHLPFPMANELVSTLSRAIGPHVAVNILLTPRMTCPFPTLKVSGFASPLSAFFLDPPLPDQ